MTLPLVVGEYERSYPRSIKNKRIGRVAAMSEPTQAEARRIAEEARDRVRFEEEALDLSDQVFRVARHLVSSREEAEDLMQETYARAFRSWRSYTPGTNLRAWLLRILTNLNVDRGRKIQRSPQTQPLEETDYYLANKLASAGGEEVLETDEVVERLSQDSIVNALSEIPPQFRDVVVLVDIGDFSYADAAQILDVPIGTVMSRLHRGRRALKQHLAEEALS
jgi:RNA polymerase sigma-70 factor, ECF subfamily